jgi:hypothetical protein
MTLPERGRKMKLKKKQSGRYGGVIKSAVLGEYLRGAIFVFVAQ